MLIITKKEGVLRLKPELKVHIRIREPPTRMQVGSIRFPKRKGAKTRVNIYVKG